MKYNVITIHDLLFAPLLGRIMYVMPSEVFLLSKYVHCKVNIYINWKTFQNFYSQEIVEISETDESSWRKVLIVYLIDACVSQIEYFCDSIFLNFHTRKFGKIPECFGFGSSNIHVSNNSIILWKADWLFLFVLGYWIIWKGMHRWIV